MPKERPLDPNVPILEIVNILALIIVAILVFPLTEGMTPGAEMFPRIMAGGLIVVGMIEVFRNATRTRRWLVASRSGELDRDTYRDRENWAGSALTTIAFFSLVLIFAFLFNIIGFIASAFLFMIASITLLAPSQVVRHAPVALAVPIAIQMVFGWGLGIRLPLIPFLQ